MILGSHLFHNLSSEVAAWVYEISLLFLTILPFDFCLAARFSVNAFQMEVTSDFGGGEILPIGRLLITRFTELCYFI